MTERRLSGSRRGEKKTDGDDRCTEAARAPSLGQAPHASDGGQRGSTEGH
jgi:hypothetical protein